MATRAVPQASYPGPISSNILEDFQAPPEATRPLQEHITRIRQAFGATDGQWLRLKLFLKNNFEMSEAEFETILSFEQALQSLNLTILNRPQSEQPNQDPAKGAQNTV